MNMEVDPKCLSTDSIKIGLTYAISQGSDLVVRYEFKRVAAVMYDRQLMAMPSSSNTNKNYYRWD